ncbi:helix-turn-helix domain-containing protein [Nocardioides oleivorans]|uniref:Helix-turn-helix domain-containing protein n=1 Tax=Nocardioides oleivorans TaxID=273676 RepID=A0A4Q2RY90_9ACTN|nr:helix-turn-helix domain-containing protein [Nocardioides oleivorans]RYB92899.1 helix-turn-helix domain-containing protein [Nocardioides oleivorans]
MSEPGRDRLRELLDAVLDEEHATLADMAGGAFSSPHHFNRRVRSGTGEPPVALRRRVQLERAAWRLSEGASVTDAAFESGYESVEGFARAYARAFGHPPSTPAAGHWLPAPNGIHFHPPMSLWVTSTEQAMNPITEHLVRHDLDDTRHLIDLAKGVPGSAYDAPVVEGLAVLGFDGPDESLGQLLEHLVASKEIWLAAIAGEELPTGGGRGAIELLERHDAVAPRWLATVRDLDARGAWDDRLVDALCDPPESFVMGSVFAHVVTYAAARRQVARHVLRRHGVTVDEGDPITWLRGQRGEE